MPGIEVVTTFQPDETVWVLAYIYDRRTGLAADPTTITVTISDPDGIAQISDKAMSKHANGEYEYFYNLASDAPRGNKWWRGVIKVVDGSGESAKTTIGTFGFRIK